MTPELFDTHCHFLPGADIGAQIARAKECGVTRIMAIGGSEELNETAVKANTGFFAVGWDRDQWEQATGNGEQGTGNRGRVSGLGECTAVGEIGLDYYYDPDHRKEQLKLFEAQLQLAAELDKPVVIHTREADDDTLGALRSIPSRGIIHCFTGTPDFCRKLLDLGFMVSISGIVTFRKADNVRESALVVPDDRILIETDSPFLAPVPMRGKDNEPSFLVHTARFLAGLRKTKFEDFAALTTANALKTLCKH